MYHATPPASSSGSEPDSDSSSRFAAASRSTLARSSTIACPDTDGQLYLRARLGRTNLRALDSELGRWHSLQSGCHSNNRSSIAGTHDSTASSHHVRMHGLDMGLKPSRSPHAIQPTRPPTPSLLDTRYLALVSWNSPLCLHLLPGSPKRLMSTRPGTSCSRESQARSLLTRLGTRRADSLLPISRTSWSISRRLLYLSATTSDRLRWTSWPLGSVVRRTNCHVLPSIIHP